MTAHLIVDILDQAMIPFEAKIRRTSELGTQYFIENGIWKGVLAFKSHVIIEESDVILKRTQNVQSQFLQSGSSFEFTSPTTKTLILVGLFLSQINFNY